ncbi:biotin synthase [Brevirhabdus pacifica]|uniref:biotin synthase BioB n=1 Tax=Brevirhabdus pacifica TaxID=1267768 RepID=UPI0009FB5A9D|nr:biotin synthase BioB [Brevirhabdus pacifica]PJJ86474.1 biotin synthase [Brevirhabdus pacifica]
MRDAAERWSRDEAQALHDLPLFDLLYRAQTIHREHFDPNEIQTSTLLSIKTGGCAEDCAYCSQSARNGSKLPAAKLIEVERVLAEARRARDSGATRFCMGAAWREPKARDMPALVAMVEGVREMGMETCMTLGMLDDTQVAQLREAGLDYYNHNIDTSERYYPEVITTRTFADRLDTLSRVREAGIKVCSGGILGMGETGGDRIDMLLTLANLPEPPESVPINMLMPQPDTPLAAAEPVDPIAFVRLIALARILMPRAYVRISAGRTDMSDETQALCFMAGANSIFSGDRLLTADNPEESRDAALFAKLGLRVQAAPVPEGRGAPEAEASAEEKVTPACCGDRAPA